VKHTSNTKPKEVETRTVTTLKLIVTTGRMGRDCVPQFQNALELVMSRIEVTKKELLNSELYSYDFSIAEENVDVSR
jgi:hypothetical protein